MPENSGEYLSAPKPKSPSRSFRQLLSAFLGGGYPSYELRNTGDYRFFETPESRKEIFEVGERLCEYMHDERIPNIAFMDRAARPAYLALREYWHYAYPEEQLPHIYFVSPKGFKTPEELAEIGVTGMPRLIEEAIIAREKGEPVEDPSHVRSAGEIQHELETSYKHLMQDKDKPLLLFDNCVHKGDTIAPVSKMFEDVGFEDVRFGITSEEDNYSGIEPDFIALDEPANYACYPFHHDSLLEKTYSSVTSIKSGGHRQQIKANAVRDEVIRIMREHIALQKQKEASTTDDQEH